ncbi:MAG: helix-turn-helix domain-containing protein [Cyanobacteria bacterium REEB65]|nr:helix-turn-helix domain-containing protein [Cyanobacteria bacterium REEB65]
MHRIKLARLVAGLSRKQVATRSIIGVRTLAAWEDGEATSRFPGVVKLSEIYGVPADALAGDFTVADLVEAKANHV